MKHVLLAAAGLAAGALPCLAEPQDTGAQPDAASARPAIVLELFANRNCPACPKAHANMRELAATRDDVLILTWSVNYWDYLGEPDSMALPEAVARQEAYAEQFGLRGPYTPQVVVNGVDQVSGAKMRRLKRALDRAAGEDAAEPAVSARFLGEGAVALTGPGGATETLVLADTAGMDMVNPVAAVSD